MRSVSIDHAVVMASLYGWLRSGREKSLSTILPAPTDSSTSAANEGVEEVLKKKRRKRGKYNYYEPELRAKIAKHACQHGNKSAVVKYSKDLGHSVSESSVRNIKKAYLDKLKTVQDPNDIISLPRATLGRPLLLGEVVDTKVAEYIHALRLVGGIVNHSIVQAAARELELPEDHVCLAIFDVFSAHRCDSVLKKLNENHIHQVFVPASCTGELQPLDLSVNDEFKALMKDNFSRWYTHEIKEALDQGDSLENVSKS